MDVLYDIGLNFGNTCMYDKPQCKNRIMWLIYMNILGADVNRCDDVGGLTALLWAAAYGQLTTIEFLLENDGDLNAIGGNGENCLLLASAGGYKDIVRMCLQKGQQVNYVDEVILFLLNLQCTFTLNWQGNLKLTLLISSLFVQSVGLKLIFTCHSLTLIS